MGKKITLTLTTGLLSGISADEIESVCVINGSTLIVKKN